MLPENWVNLATVGTEQSDAAAVQVEQPLANILDQLPESEPEAKLLLAVAGQQLQHNAGYRPLQDQDPLPPPDPIADQPTCRLEAITYLQLMLGGQHKGAMPEWFNAVEHRRQCVPAELLPTLLDAGHNDPALQPFIGPVLGHRGVWLAQASGNPRWTWFQPDLDQMWEEGKVGERAHLLGLMRQTEPARARAMLESSWQQESAKDRERFIYQLSYNLSQADESFLERALDDRSKGVRQAAAHLLAKLPESGFRQRTQARVTRLLDLTKTGLRRKPTLVVTLPESCPADLRRDGVDDKSNLCAVDAPPERAWLAHMLSYVPPSFWCEQWQMTPQALVQAAGNSKMPFDIVMVWGWASYYTDDVAFMPYLLQHEAEKLNPTLRQRLAQRLSAETRETVAQAHLKADKDGFKTNQPLMALLAAHQQPWSRELTLGVVKGLSQYLRRRNSRPDYNLRASILDFACFFPADMKDELLSILRTKSSKHELWEDFVDEIEALLDFRQKMLRAIGP